MPFALPPFALYRALRRINPAPFLFYLDFGGFSVVGSSPEVLVRLRDGMVTIRPLAGTRRRGATHEEDQALEAELLADPKERAEHLMLLDLGRNDVGRVSALRFGEGDRELRHRAVQPRDAHFVQRGGQACATAWTRWTRWSGGFPAGTLSGAPKVRAMEIIEELEPDRRNIYAGCIGYFAANGTMDTCIGLRTALVKDGVMYVQAGAGIVADFGSRGGIRGVPAEGAGPGARGGGGGAVRRRQVRRQCSLMDYIQRAASPGRMLRGLFAIQFRGADDPRNVRRKGFNHELASRQ